MARVSRPAYDPRCYRLPPRKPLPSREALVLWIGLQPLRQVADIWPLRPADNQPNPCRTQCDTRRRGRPFYDRLSPLIAIRKPHAAVRQESIPSFSRSGNDGKMRWLRRLGSASLTRSTALSLRPMWHEGVPAGTERYLTRFHCETRIHGLSWRERDQQPLANQGTNSGTHPGEGPAARL